MVIGMTDVLIIGFSPVPGINHMVYTSGVNHTMHPSGGILRLMPLHQSAEGQGLSLRITNADGYSTPLFSPSLTIGGSASGGKGREKSVPSHFYEGRRLKESPAAQSFYQRRKVQE
jgi:hypothetical protein